MISCYLQIAPLYEKLKYRLYNSLYRRQKRLESRFNGDVLKMREELGVDVPQRAKRPRRSKGDSESSQSVPSATASSEVPSNVPTVMTDNALGGALLTNQGDICNFLLFFRYASKFTLKIQYLIIQMR